MADGKIYLDMNLIINEEVEEEQPEMAKMKLQNIRDLTLCCIRPYFICGNI